MSQSIRLSGDNYWDTVGIRGGRIITSAGGAISASGGTREITIPNSWRGIFFVFSPGSVTQCLWLVNTNSSGVLNVTEVSGSTLITYTATTNKLTISNSGGASVYPYYISATTNTVLSYE